MLLSSPHVHTQFCDGSSTAEEIVLSALRHGCQSLGFSSHSRQYFGLEYAMDSKREQAYIAEIRRLQKQYAGQLRIWLGLELDLFSCADTAVYDYFIGSVHCVPDADGFADVDGAPKRLLRLIDEKYHGDGLMLAEEYFSLYGAMMRARHPLIGGHFDLVRKYNQHGRLFDEAAPRYRRAVQSALRAARESGVILEVNTGGMARYHAALPYPDSWILKVWKDMDGEIILSSDCHRAPDILAGYGQAVTLLQQLGYQKARALGTGNELLVDTPLELER